MEYVYATLMLNETGAEINEQNLTATLEAAGASTVQSRVKALVAALEDVDLDELATQAGLEDELSSGAGNGATSADEDATDGADEPSGEDDDREPQEPAEATAAAEATIEDR